MMYEYYICVDIFKMFTFNIYHVKKIAAGNITFFEKMKFEYNENKFDQALRYYSKLIQLFSSDYGLKSESDIVSGLSALGRFKCKLLIVIIKPRQTSRFCHRFWSRFWPRFWSRLWSRLWSSPNPDCRQISFVVVSIGSVVIILGWFHIF